MLERHSNNAEEFDILDGGYEGCRLFYDASTCALCCEFQGDEGCPLQDEDCDKCCKEWWEFSGFMIEQEYGKALYWAEKLRDRLKDLWDKNKGDGKK